MLCLACALAACGPSRPAGGGDAGGDAGADQGAPDLGVILTGNLLLAGDLDVNGMTSDDVVAVFDHDRGVLAVPAAGGDAQVVDAASDGALVVGPVIVSLHNFDNVAAIGDLTIWTAAFGAVPFATDATPLVAVSDDGTRLLATRDSSSDG